MKPYRNITFIVGIVVLISLVGSKVLGSDNRVLEGLKDVHFKISPLSCDQGFNSSPKSGK